MLLSNLLGERLREKPADAKIVSQIFLMRGGYIRHVSNGSYSLLYPSVRITQKIERIIRDEMNKIGGQEVSMPVVLPRELWDESGRYESVGAELLRLKDRGGRDMLLAMTHEEAAVHLVRDDVTSYGRFPFMLYQFQTKFRDEPRCKGGLIRVREFTMKDAYSFHTSQKDLEEYYDKCYKAYNNIFRRIGIPEVVAVASDTGMMGGKVAHEFMLLCDAGEDTICVCEECGSYENIEVAPVRAVKNSLENASISDENPLKNEAKTSENEAENRAKNAENPLIFEVKSSKDSLKNGEKTAENRAKNNEKSSENSSVYEEFTPSIESIDTLSAHFKIPKSRIIKSAVFAVEGSDRVVVVFIRGDYEVNDTKLAKIVKANVFPLEGRNADLEFGYIGPIGLEKDKITTYDKTEEGDNADNKNDKTATYDKVDGDKFNGINKKNDKITVVYDKTIEGECGMVAGANKKNYHLRNVNVGRDFDGEFFDVAKVNDGDLCICGGTYTLKKGIEVGNIFQLGTKYSAAMKMSYLDENGASQIPIMGCYGIGVGRAMASVAEVRHDDSGPIWPFAIAPWEVHINLLSGSDNNMREAAFKLYRSLLKAGIEVIIDDRKVSAGVQFADADLLGVPFRVIFGVKNFANGQVEFCSRDKKIKEIIPIGEIRKTVLGYVRKARKEALNLK